MNHNDDMRRPTPNFPETIEQALQIQRGFGQAPISARMQAAPITPSTPAERLAQHQWRDIYTAVLARYGLVLGEVDATGATIACRACGLEWRISTATGLSESTLICEGRCNLAFVAEMQGNP